MTGSPVPVERDLDQRAETADAAEHLAAACERLTAGLMRSTSVVAGFDIDAGIAICR